MFSARSLFTRSLVFMLRLKKFEIKTIKHITQMLLLMRGAASYIQLINGVVL